MLVVLLVFYSSIAVYTFKLLIKYIDKMLIIIIIIIVIVIITIIIVDEKRGGIYPPLTHLVNAGFEHRLLGTTAQCL